MGPIEKLGLLKMDFLGLKTLTVISDALRLLKESRGIELDGDGLPLDDARTYQLLSEARTFGVFQLESAGMRDALKRLKPQRIEDIIAMVALYRPGPMDLIEDFVNRKHGRAEISYEHPLMEQVLQETYGIMVYQEQVMRLAADLAGFSLGEADTLRKAMGKKDRDLMATQREKFVSGCKANKIDAKKAERIWDLIEKFAGYGFNKCLTARRPASRWPTASRSRSPRCGPAIWCSPRTARTARARCGRAGCARSAGSSSPTACPCAARRTTRSSPSAAG